MLQQKARDCFKKLQDSVVLPTQGRCNGLFRSQSTCGTPEPGTRRLLVYIELR
jgi:hypothetical protein